MMRHDHFQSRRVHRYNVDLAINIARDRITNWCNGALPHTPPRGESFPDNLVEIILCRN